MNLKVDALRALLAKPFKGNHVSREWLIDREREEQRVGIDGVCWVWPVQDTERQNERVR